MKKIFEFYNYKGNYVMHCKTEKEARDFCKTMHEAGRVWESTYTYEEKIYWETYEQDTCYNFNSGTYCNVQHYIDEDYVVLEWSDFIQDPRETIVYRLSGYDVEVALEEMRIEYTEEQLHNMIAYIQEHNLSIPYGEYMNPIIEMAIEDGVMGYVPFEPKEGNGYYYPSIGYIAQVGCKNWCNSPTDRRIKKYVGCYRTKEEAIAKAKELWGLED